MATSPQRPLGIPKLDFRFVIVSEVTGPHPCVQAEKKSQVDFDHRVDHLPSNYTPSDAGTMYTENGGTQIKTQDCPPMEVVQG